MGKPGAFLEVGRRSHSERPWAETIGDYDEFALPLAEDEQQAQASRCMMCGVAFCQAGVSFGRSRTSGCPLHNLIPEWNDLLYRGQWKAAWERLTLTNPFPEVTGRVCPALCETACNLGTHDDPTTIKDDERAIIEHAFAEGWVAPFEPAGADAPKVAIVGAGPSGLACASELARSGVRVTVFDKADRPGGLLMYGIPAMKLPKEVIDRRIDLLRQSGVEFVLEADVRDEKTRALLADYDQVVVAVGAREPRRLKVPGADLDGVVYAVDYLTESTRALLDGTPARTAEGLDVVVIGGGDTGTDCVATALRQGAKSVRQFEFLPEPGRTREAVGSPWPEYPIVRKDDYGQLEATARDGADPRTWAADTREVRGEDGRVASILVQRLDWSDGSPRRIEGSEEVVPAQLVLIAMGFTGAEADTLAALEGIPHVTCGDAKTGSSLVVNAISGGVACAHEVLDGLAAR